MEEVVARRRNAAGAAYIFVIVVGIALIVAGIAIGGEEKGALVIGLIIGGIILAMGIYYTVRFFMLPSKIIVYRDGVLCFPRNVTCKPEEIQKVFIKVFRGKYGNVSRYGKLEVTVCGKIYRYNDVADVREAQERLLQLNAEAVNALNNPVPQPEPAADAQPSAADPFKEI